MSAGLSARSSHRRRSPCSPLPSFSRSQVGEGGRREPPAPYGAPSLLFAFLTPFLPSPTLTAFTHQLTHLLASAPFLPQKVTVRIDKDVAKDVTDKADEIKKMKFLGMGSGKTSEPQPIKARAWVLQ